MAIKEHILYLSPDNVATLNSGVPVILEGMGTKYRIIPEPDPDDQADLERKEAKA